MANADFPESYRDPLYAQLDAENEQRHGLPVGMLSSIRAYGERTDASKKSSAGAVTPYQFIPATREAVLKKYGIDPTLSPDTASEAAALLLKEALKRNNGDPEKAVREYHGGTDPKNWGPVNDAYWKRVAGGMQAAKTPALADGFGKFLAANPPAPKGDKLAEGFGQWLQAKEPPQIPGTDPAWAAGTTPAQNQPDTTMLDRVIGAGEAGLSALTAATSGTVGLAGGTVAGIVDAIGNGSFGTPQGANAVEQSAARGMDALTYSPRTPQGQEQTQALGEVMQQVLPVLPMAPEMAALARGAQPAASLAAATTAATLDRAGVAAKAGAGRVASIVGRADPAAPTPGTLGSAGAAGTDIATMRRQTAESLPVPVQLTRGQAERSFEQQRFEQETAKDPTNGAPLRDRYAEQNAAIPRNFEAWIDDTGAQAATPIEVGRAVDTALVRDAARAKAEYRVRYREARAAGETAEPVDMTPLAEYLNTNRAGRTSAPIMATIADELGVQGIGEGSLADGSIVARNATLEQAETLRKAVNRFVKDTDPNDVRIGSEIKAVIDQITEGQGGQLYKEARKARQRYAQLYEDNAIVSDLLKSRRGTSDRQVALENVFRRTILNGTREDLSKLRRTLQVSGSEEGAQAWRELQGATVRHIIDEATKGVGTDVRGNPIVSAAKMNSTVRALETGGRLDFILGRQGAQQIRDINDLAKVIYTAPPGSVNTSNTASVILAALAESGVNGSMTGLPIPVLTGLKVLSMHVKDRRIQKRVQEALGRAQAAPQRTQPTPAPQGRTIH